MYNLWAATNEIVVVDRFDQAKMINLMGGGTQGDEEFPGGCIPTFTEEEGYLFGARGHSLRLEYDVTLPGSFSFYWSKLGLPGLEAGTSHPLDLSGAKYFSFWFKSDQAKPAFSVEIHQDKDGDELFILSKDITSKVLLSGYITSEDTTRWRKIVVPLNKFRRVEDWSKILEIVFVFENRTGSGSGTIYIDDILFGSNFPERDEQVEPLNKEKLFGDFKINELGSRNSFPLQDKNYLSLTLKETPPYLESISFQVSTDLGAGWQEIDRFYELKVGANYKGVWSLNPQKGATSYLLRAVATDLWGEDTVLTGPLVSQR